jgi:hypothetical protein
VDSVGPNFGLQSWSGCGFGQAEGAARTRESRRVIQICGAFDVLQHDHEVSIVSYTAACSKAGDLWGFHDAAVAPAADFVDQALCDVDFQSIVDAFGGEGRVARSFPGRQSEVKP